MDPRHDSPDGAGTAGESPSPPRPRASDADRAATVALLQDAVTRGLLTPDEGSERMAAAFASTYVDELPAMTADLPARPPSTPTAPGWRTLGSLAALQTRSTLQTAPTRNPRLNAALAVVLVLVVLLLIGLTLAGGHGHQGPGPEWHGFRH